MLRQQSMTIQHVRHEPVTRRRDAQPCNVQVVNIWKLCTDSSLAAGVREPEHTSSSAAGVRFGKRVLLLVPCKQGRNLNVSHKHVRPDSAGLEQRRWSRALRSTAH